MAPIISRIREPGQWVFQHEPAAEGCVCVCVDVKTYTQDGVFLTESGLSHLQSLVEPLTTPRGYRR